VDALLAADGEDRHDVRVVQVGRGLGLVLEALQAPVVQSRRERQHFQRHLPLEGDLLRFVNDAHAAAAHFAQDAIIAELAEGARARRRTRAARVARFALLAEAVQHDQGGHQLGDLLRQVGVAGGQGGHVRLAAGAEAGLDFLGQLADGQGVAVVARPGREADGELVAWRVAHGRDPPAGRSAIRSSLSRSRARP
jgi:hypothetical protein